MGHGIRRALDVGYDEAVARLPEALKAEGFGVLTEIDIKNTLRQKLDVDFRRYKIFGACNPPLAYQALQAELEIGVMLPCNVIVYESEGRAVVVAIDPTRTLAGEDSPALSALAETVKQKLTRVIEAL